MSLKDDIKESNIKSYVSVNKDDFPIVYNLNGKEYEIRHTNGGGLVMRGYVENDEFHQESIEEKKD